MKFKSNKQKFVIVGIVLALIFVIGAFINFYTMNLFTLTIMEKKSPAFYWTFFTWFAGYSIAIEFILAFMFIVRSILHPNIFKRMVKFYSILLLSFSGVGLVSSLVSGIAKYNNMATPYPFAGYHLIALILHVLIIAFAILCLTYLKKFIKPDTSTMKIKASYVWQTIGIVFVYLILFNRFGALLWAPTYGPTIPYGKIVPFYLLLFLPVLMLAHGVVYVFGGYKNKTILCRIFTYALLAIGIALYATVVAFELTDPEFVSKISMAMAIERASSKPADTIFMALAIPGALIGMTVEQSIKFSKIKKAS